MTRDDLLIEAMEQDRRERKADAEAIVLSDEWLSREISSTGCSFEDDDGRITIEPFFNDDNILCWRVTGESHDGMCSFDNQYPLWDLNVFPSAHHNTISDGIVCPFCDGVAEGCENCDDKGRIYIPISHHPNQYKVMLPRPVEAPKPRQGVQSRSSAPTTPDDIPF